MHDVITSDVMASSETLVPERPMRTTLDIDEDILLAARDRAASRRVSTGKALSDLAREALTRPQGLDARNGIPLFPRQAGAGVVTLELVNRLREETL
jgi:hypothetical protein